MKILNLFFFNIICLLYFSSLNAQEIVSYQKVKTMTKQEISNTLFIPAKYDVDVYNIIYTSKKMNLQKDTASGIIAVAKTLLINFR
ncbi:MAG: hypothetical protein IPH57_16775 [Saprospiraceae bacterium]|nr:hypothetical protein [Saprospiraceae bacterium]